MKTMRLAVLSLLAISAAAWADEVVIVPVPAPPRHRVYLEPAPVYPAPYYLQSTIGMEFLVGIGVSHYFDRGATSEIGPGFAWSARFDIGTRRHLGGELGYIGTAQPLNDSRNSTLVSNGVETLVRWNILTGWVQPYAGVGIGYKRYSLLSPDGEGTASVRPFDDVIHVPAAVGLAFRAHGLVFDTRFAISAPLDGNLVPGSYLAAWDLTAKVGYEF